MVGAEAEPVALTVPEMVPDAPTPGAKELISVAGRPEIVALRLSADPAVPETVTVPPPMPSASCSRLACRRKR